MGILQDKPSSSPAGRAGWGWRLRRLAATTPPARAAAGDEGRHRARRAPAAEGWLISFAYRRLIVNPDPPLPARDEPRWAEAAT